MDSTTGGDANDEFARWLAETARAEQAAAPAPAQPAAQPPVPGQQPPAPEFFGADQLAAPPTRPYEPQLGGPPVARSSYQAPGGVPATPPPPATEYVTPAVLPAAPPAAAPAAEPPSWAPGYTAPGSPDLGTADPVAPQQPAAPAPPTTPYEAPPAFGEPPAATPFFPAAPDAQPAAPQYSAPIAPPSFDSPAAPSFPPSAPAVAPPAFDPSAFQRPAPDVPAFDAPAYEPPAQAPAYQPAAPAYEPPPAASGFPPLSEHPLPPAEPPAADPFGALFATDDTASRLAASPPPSLVSPPAGELPADEDPLKALFGLETEEQPAVPAEFAAPPAPVELPTYTPEPAAAAAPVYTPEPAFAAAPAPTPEPAFAAAPSTASGTSSYALTDPATVPADDDPSAGTQFFGGGVGEWEEPPDLDRSTVGEKVGLALSVLLPPIGLIGSIVNAVQSSRERGWVHRIVKVSLVLAVILTVVAGFAGAYLYKVVDDARKHDALAAASTQFCATVAADPSMIAPPTFGFPAPAASIPDTITAIQAYVDKWEALAKVSPSGIRTDVNRVADSASGILDTVTTSRLVNNEDNIAVMSSVAESTNVVGWSEEYCG